MKTKNTSNNHLVEFTTIGKSPKYVVYFHLFEPFSKYLIKIQSLYRFYSALVFISYLITLVSDVKVDVTGPLAAEPFF